jgi:uncharacterized membrane protein
LEITGVLFEFGSVLLQAASNIRPQANMGKRNRLAVIILNGSNFTPVLRHGLARHTILTLNPAAKIN